MLPRRQVVAGAVLVGAGILLGPAAARGAVTPVFASAVPVTLSATSLHVDRLVYGDVVPISTAAGPVQAVELDITGATFDALGVALPCVPIKLGGLTGATATTAETTAGQLTVYATDVTVTLDGSRVRWSSTDPAYPPPPAGTEVLDHTFVEPTMVAALATSTSLHVAASSAAAPGLTTTATFCSPGSTPAPAGVPLTAKQPPAASSEQPATSGEPSSPPPATGQPGKGPSQEPTGSSAPTPSPAPTDQPSTGATTDPAAPSTGDPGPTVAPSPTP